MGQPVSGGYLCCSGDGVLREAGPAAAFVEALEAELLAAPETGAAVCAVVACSSQWNGSNCVSLSTHDGLRDA